MRSIAFAALCAATLIASRDAAASPDPYSPSMPPPVAYGAYSSPPIQTNFVPRSPALRALGIALSVLGGLTLVAAPVVASTSTSPAGDPSASSSTDGPVLGMALGGAGLLALGIPIAVYGSAMVPPPRPSAVRFTPTATGFRVTF